MNLTAKDTKEYAKDAKILIAVFANNFALLAVKNF